MVCIQYKNRDTEKIVFSPNVKLKCPTNQVWKGKDLQAKAMSTAYVHRAHEHSLYAWYEGSQMCSSDDGEGGGGGGEATQYLRYWNCFQ